MTLTEREFLCTRCELAFSEKVGQYECGVCPKCRDMEYVRRRYDYESVAKRKVE